MATPEFKVKVKVKALLKKYGAYYFMPATHGYGSSGVPDIVACMKSRFIGIECKANGGKPTTLQIKNLIQIVDRGGISLLVDESGIDSLEVLLTAWESKGIPPQGFLFELLNAKKQTK